MTVRTLSPMAPRCTGTCGAFATSPPSASKTAQEKSRRDRKSTRLNSSHVNISYAVFCLRKIGEVRHLRADYLQDWITGPNLPLVWRLKKEVAGPGALDEIAAHITGLGLYLVGPLSDRSE